MKTLWKPIDMLSLGFLFIFLLSGIAIAGQSQDSPGWPDALSEISYHLHHPQDGSSIGPGRSDSFARISSHRERILMDRANLSAKIQNLSETYSQKHEVQLANSSAEGCTNCSNSDHSALDVAQGDRKGYFENYMDINVAGISVRAVNTVEGGSATATSNIIIEPVQVIDLTSEVAEKLR